jgi:hypothetical protein
MTALPTRAQVERAEPLEFATPPRSARNDLTITVKARVAGFDTEVCYTGSIEQLDSLVKRLRELGAEPAGVAVAAAPATKQPAKRVQPAYNGDGEPICPTHGTKLREGRWGLFCPTKDKQSGEYCKLKFEE